MEMTRCMLYEKELPKKLWTEVASTAVFLLNRLPSRVLNKKISFEGWFGYKPDLQNMKNFCCLYFSFVPQVKRDKLDKKAEPRVFIGYNKSTATPMNQREKFNKEDGADKVEEHDIKSTIGYCFSFGSGMFSWSSKKQDTVAQSTAEAEYVATTTAVNQAIWLRRILANLHMEQKEPTQILVDNQTTISISNNPDFHGKTKHFKIKLFFLRETQREGEVKLIYCRSEDQSADILTKVFPKARFEVLRNKLGVCNH